MRAVPPVRPASLVVGLLAENTPRMLAQAFRLLRSIRWFGGEMSGVRTLVCIVGTLDPRVRQELEALGAEVRSVTRFHPANPTANRHQLIAALLDTAEEMVLALDCDTIVVRDPLPYLDGETLRAKVAPTATVSDEVFERLFAHFHLPKPPRTHINRLTGTPTIPYFNAGVIAVPKRLLRVLAPSWRKFNLALADQPQLVAPCERHMHQASMTLALVETGIPFAELPEEMNFQTNAQHVEAPPEFDELDPAIIHYHHLSGDDGLILPVRYPRTQSRIDMFNDRMRAEGLAHAKHVSPHGAQSQPIVVLGMHRSGTSLVTELIAAMGSHAGEAHEHTPADMFNPTGYWEHREVVAIDNAMLEALSATWSDNLGDIDISRLSSTQRAEFSERARKVVESLQGHGSYLIKDPRMSLLFPLWRDVFGKPVCVIAWRDPLAVAQSLHTRNRQPLLVSLAAWDHYNRALLRDTEGLPRVLVSYDDLLADPAGTVHALQDALRGFGISDLVALSDERIRQIVNADFNRSGRKARRDETLLDPDQRQLVADLRSGTALTKTIAPTPARSFELLATFAAAARREQGLRDDLAELDQILGAVFNSTTWRVGHAGTALVRVLRRGNAISAMERWENSKRRRLES